MEDWELMEAERGKGATNGKYGDISVPPENFRDDTP